jgi:hypothetical protein
MAEDKAVESQIKEAAWQWIGWGLFTVLTFLAGVAVAYLMWGDATSLRQQTKDLTQKVAAARTEREDMQAVVNRVQRENERCTQQLNDLKKAAAAPAGTAPTP